MAYDCAATFADVLRSGLMNKILGRFVTNISTAQDREKKRKQHHLFAFLCRICSTFFNPYKNVAYMPYIFYPLRGLYHYEVSVKKQPLYGTEPIFFNWIQHCKKQK